MNTIDRNKGQNNSNIVSGVILMVAIRDNNIKTISSSLPLVLNVLLIVIVIPSAHIRIINNMGA